MSAPPKIPSLQPRVLMAGGQVGSIANSGWQDDRRASRHERGYGNAWGRLRLVILKRDMYLCQCDQCGGGLLRVKPAHEVDHKISKAEWQMCHGSTEGVDNPANLQAINRDCHREKTEADRKRLLDR